MSMQDSSTVEHEAETRIQSELLGYDVLVAKPLWDKRGADLLAMLSVDDGTKFIRIQSKGRTLEDSSRPVVKIPTEYVTSHFAVFLYSRHRQSRENRLMLFLPSDLRAWSDSNGHYVLRYTWKQLQKKLAHFVASDERLQLLVELIKTANVPEQFQVIQRDARSRLVEPGLVEIDLPSGKTLKCRNEPPGWRVTSVDPNLGVEVTRTDCPGNPRDFEYDEVTDTWSAR